MEQLQEQVVQTPEEKKDITAVIDEMLQGGATEEQVLTTLQEMVTKGELTEEELQKAVAYFQEKEKASAGQMFGLNLQ